MEYATKELDYFSQVKYQQLTKEDENKLFEKMHEGNQEAREFLIINNINFIKSLISKLRYIPETCDKNEVMQDSLLLLIEAIDKFDYKKANKFSTYFYKTFKNRMYGKLDEYKSQGIHIPEYIRRLKANHLEKIKQLNAKDLLKYLENNKISQEIYESIMHLEEGFIYLDDSQKNIKKIELKNDLDLEKEYIENAQNNRIKEMIQSSNLTEEELLIVTEKIGLVDNIPKTNKYIGTLLNKSIEYARITFNEAIIKIVSTHYEELSELTNEDRDNIIKHLTKITVKKEEVAKDKNQLIKNLKN